MDIRRKLRAAVIGIGNMGRHHARVYSELPQTELCAVADTNRDLLQRFNGMYGCSVFADYRKMLYEARPDIITIAVPTRMHTGVAMDVIASGIPFLLEKPIAPNIASAKKIIKAAGRRNLPYLIGHIERFNPSIIKLKSIIDKGELGDITTISAKRVGVYQPQIMDTNIIIDVSIHDIEILNYLTGRIPDNIYVNGGNALIQNQTDFVDILLTYGSITGTAQANWITPIKIRTLTVTGTKGYAELDYITQELILYKSTYFKLKEGYREFLKFGKPRRKTIPVKTGEPLKLEIENLIRAIRTGTPPAVSGSQAAEALKVALIADRKIRKMVH